MKQKINILALVLLLGAADVAAQESLGLTSQRLYAEARFGAVYQQVDDDGRRIEELATPLTLRVPVGRHFRFGLRTSQAVASGEALETVRGLDDVQATAAYARRLGGASLVVSLGLNLPTGARSLSTEAFRTVFLLSQDYYTFQVPSFGQGFNVAPGMALALPLSDGLVFGASLAYQRRGAFEPLDGLDGSYDPGDEVLAAAGIEARLGRSASFALDASYTAYQTDEQGGRPIFALGDRLRLRAQGRLARGFDEGRLVAEYIHHDASILLDGTTAQARQTIPNRIELGASYRMRLARRWALTLLGRARFFGETEARSSLLPDETLVTGSREVVEAGVAPEFRLARTLRLTGRLMGTAGAFSGIEAGLGLAVRL